MNAVEQSTNRATTGGMTLTIVHLNHANKSTCFDSDQKETNMCTRNIK